MIALYFLPPQRLPITDGRESLFLLDKLYQEANLTLSHKVVALFEDANRFLDKVKIYVIPRRTFCEAIASDATDPVSKTTD